MLAHAAVADEFGMVDNVTALPLRYSEASGYEAEWLLLFTNKGDCRACKTPRNGLKIFRIYKSQPFLRYPKHLPRNVYLMDFECF